MELKEQLEKGFSDVKATVKQTAEELAGRIDGVEAAVTANTESITAISGRVDALEGGGDETPPEGGEAEASATIAQAKASMMVFTKQVRDANTIRRLERKSLCDRLAHSVTKGDFCKFLRYAKDRNGVEVKALGGTPDASGGFLVPTEHRDAILEIIEEFGWARRLGQVVPMTSEKMDIPKVGTAVTGSWVDEGVIAPDADPVFAQVTLTAEEARFKSVVSNALLQDSVPAVDSILLDQFGRAQAKLEDDAAFNGQASGASDPHEGILKDATVNVVVSGGVNLAYDDIVELEAALTGGARIGAWIYVSRKGFRHLRLLKDSQGRPLWTDNIQDGTLGSIFGYPVAILESGIPDNLGVGLDETAFILGNMQNLIIGDRLIFSVRSSDQVRFENAQTVFMADSRIAIEVALGNGFAKLTGIVA